MPDNNKDVNTYKDYIVSCGMLSSPQIKYYQKHYEIIGNYEESGLGPASYHMRVGREVLTWHEGVKDEFILGENEDSNHNIKKSVELRPNSLTFLTTIEEFRLPKDIIARYNLKSKWVHQGLLLGTGPIVDPQLHARLLIPVHNFSSQSVIMNYGQQFISVEFTKTLNPDDELPLGNGEKSKYIENESWKYDFHSYRERIANKKVESSVLKQFEENNRRFEEAQQTIEGVKRDNEQTLSKFEKYNFVSLFGTVIAAIVLVITTWQIIHSVQDKADAVYNLIKENKESTVDFRSFALKSSYDDLQKQVLDLKRRVASEELDLKMSNRPLDFKAMQDRYKEKIESMERRIDELEHKLAHNPSVGK